LQNGERSAHDGVPITTKRPPIVQSSRLPLPVAIPMDGLRTSVSALPGPGVRE
jgi:hypothetical protein